MVWLGRLGSACGKGGTVVSLLVLGGCSGSLSMTAGAAHSRAQVQPPLCAPATAPFRVDTLDWDAATRQRFETLARQRPVVVQVSDCGWTILEGCAAQSAYVFRSLPLQRERDDGQSNSAISFGSSSAATPTVSRSATQVRDIAVAGVYEIQDAPSSVKLNGDCHGATHVVARHTTGAFRFTSQASRSGGISVPYAGQAGSADWHASVRQTGNPDACAIRTDLREPPPDCSASIQLDIEPLGQPAPWIAAAGAPPSEPAMPPTDPCTAGNAAGCHLQCVAGNASSCTALAVLCARGDASACSVSARMSLNVWNVWLATAR